MFYGEIKELDIANGEGVRVTLFVSGCRHHCKGCFNPETWDFTYGKEYTREVEDHIIDLLTKGYVDGLTILGGEPMEPENQGCVLALIERARYVCPEKTIWCYTGCVYEKDLLEGGRYHTEYTDRILSNLDVLVDGPYTEEVRNISLMFRGSENQRLIDMPCTIKTGHVVLWDPKEISM